MIHKPFPGYENQFRSYLREDTPENRAAAAANQAAVLAWAVPEGMKVEERVIPGPDQGQTLRLRIFTPRAGGPLPAVLDIHGGGWVGGSLDLDNGRCVAIATRVPCIVVSVEYRLSGPDCHFPQPLMDCYTAYRWILDHGEELGCDGQIGLHGSSAGGNLAEGLALYLRDHNQQPPALAVINCGCYTTGFYEDASYQQNYALRMGPDQRGLGSEGVYLGGYDGTTPSYYAFPGFCHDLGGLCPHLILTAEYDTLRDDGLKYAMRLLRAGVPTEIFSGGRVAHCFTAAPHPYTDLTHDLIAMALRREFGIPQQETR